MTIARRKLLAALGAAAAWPFAGRAQQAAMPVVGFVRDGSADTSARLAAAFRKGLNETGYIEGQNVTVEYHWLEGQYNRLPQLMTDLVQRQVAVIATPGNVLNELQSSLHLLTTGFGTTRTQADPVARPLSARADIRRRLPEVTQTV